MIAMEGVEKWYGPFKALTDINLTVRAGEKIVLCGPSGSGKSTLIRCINHLESYQKGRIVVDGVHLDDSQRKTIDTVRREVGMVFQQFNLFPHLTVLENCTLAPMRARGLAKRRSRSDRAQLPRARAGPRPGRQISARSSPAASSSASRSRARCAWSRRSCCSTSRPRRSIPEMVKEVLDTMIGLADDGMTMICVTHEMGFARQVADRVIFMADGRDRRGSAAGAVLPHPQHERTRKFLGEILSH